MKLQIEKLKKHIDILQKQYGSDNHTAIYGAGCIENPKILFLFMNPTAKNYSAAPDWNGIRAPWIGTKNVWKIFFALDLLQKETFDKIQKGNSNIWDQQFSQNLYTELSNQSVYITNLAKCTQVDARALRNNIFRDYLQNTLEEIYLINPVHVIAFGNQVSSILLNKNIKVSRYKENEVEKLKIKNKYFNVYPTYYPVGQGMRNMSRAIERINKIIKS